MSDPHTSVFNVELCLYGMYICWTVRHNHLSWSLVLRTVTATTFTCVVHSILSPKYWMSNSETTFDQCRQMLREKRAANCLGTNEPQHCTAYVHCYMYLTHTCPKMLYTHLCSIT